MKYKFVFLSILMLCLLACETALELNGLGDRIVVNAFVEENKPLQVQVQRSINSIGNVRSEDLKRADVSIYEEGIFKTKLKYETTTEPNYGFFNSGNFLSEVGKEYTIKVIDESLGEVQAKTIVPKTASLSNVSFKEVPWGIEEEFIEPDDLSTNFKMEFTLSLSESGTEKDYYHLKMFIPVYESFNQTTRFYGYSPVEIVPENLSDSQLYMENGLLFTSDNFEEASERKVKGIAKTFKKLKRGYVITEFSNAHYNLSLDTSEIIIKLETLSKESYEYYKSYNFYIRNYDDAFTQPTLIYNNVENGLGLFGGRSVMEASYPIE